MAHRPRASGRTRADELATLLKDPRLQLAIQQLIDKAQTKKPRKVDSIWHHAASTIVPIDTPKEGTLLWGSDVHFPYEDKRACDIFLKYAQHKKPHTCVLGGDIIDNYQLSDHDQDPARADHRLEYEFEALRPFAKELAKWCKNIHYIMGNHEERTYRLIQKVPALHGLDGLEFANLAKLPAKVKYYPYLTKLKMGRLYMHHGQIARGDGNATAASTWKKFKRSMIVGHAHGAGTHMVVDALTKESWTVIVSGTLADWKSAHYTDMPAWNTGFVTADFWTDEDGQSCFNAQHRFVINNSLAADGKVFRG